MKSVIVSHAHPAISLGGAEIAAHRLFQRLRKDREDAHFVGLNKARGESPGPFGRFQRVLEMGEGDLCVRTFGMSSDRMEQNDLAEETWLVDYFADYEADVYHFHHIWNIGVGTLLRLRKRLPSAKFVCTLHELTAICAHHGQMTKTNSHTLCHEATPMACFKCFPDLSPLYFRTRTLRMQRVLDMFDLLISPSFFLRDRFEAWGVPPGRIHVLENGLPESRPAPRDDAEALEQKSKKFAYFGRATPTKGLDVLVRATTALMRRNPELDLTVDVFGVTPENVEKFWPDLEIPPNLVLKGAYAPADGVSLMRKYGWIVLPSIWWENAPLIFQEARAAGTPVISSDIGGMREKSQAAGLRFPVGDSAALADLMETLHGNAERLKSYKHSMPKPFTLGEYVARWRSLVGSASPSGQQRAATASAQSPTMQTLKTGGYAPFIHASQRTNALTIFHHIPKTAGSSL
ncbi:MAG: glycosyltransferase, partial [Pseudomonadota bacterium]